MFKYILEPVVKYLYEVFPILPDIPKLEIQFPYLTINLILWFQTIMGFVQFMIMFYIITKIKRKIKNKIKNRISSNMDFFDKRFFNETGWCY
jgi:hypothetical protein